MSNDDKPKRVTENADFIAMIQRMIRALEVRAVDDPSILAEVIMLAQRLAEIPNVVIATSAARYKADGPMAAPSAGEIAGLLGMTKQSASERRKVGDRILFERQMGEETIPQRERAARTRARKHAETTMAEWLDRREVSAP
jgi:hypothetical protein